MRDAASLVAPLSWLAVWNRQLGGKKDSSSSSEREEQYGNDDNDDDHDYDPLARAGVLYATICQTGPSSPSPAGPDTVRSDHDERNQRDLLARRVGLAQGLVDFTR